MSKFNDDAERNPNCIKAADFKTALDQLTEDELKLPILTAYDDQHEFLTMTVSNSFDFPIVKLMTSNGPKGAERVRVIRV